MFLSLVMYWDFALILVFLATAVPFLGWRRIRRLTRMPATAKRDRLALYASTVAFQWLAAAVILWRCSVHEISFAALGLAIPNVPLTMTISVALAALILANQILSLRRLANHPSEIGGVLPKLALKIFPQDSAERLVFFAVVVTVSVCEELIYRGFAQTVFGHWFGLRAFGIGAILASSALFALGHIYQGRRGLIATFIVGMLFSLVRAWTGSLFPAMAAHFAADWTAGIMAPARLRSALESSQIAAEEVDRN
jgi:uncharacterized protein